MRDQSIEVYLRIEEFRREAPDPFNEGLSRLRFRHFLSRVILARPLLLYVARVSSARAPPINSSGAASFIAARMRRRMYHAVR